MKYNIEHLESLTGQDLNSVWEEAKPAIEIEFHHLTEYMADRMESGAFVGNILAAMEMICEGAVREAEKILDRKFRN
jgi:hypothetical protein